MKHGILFVGLIFTSYFSNAGEVSGKITQIRASGLTSQILFGFSQPILNSPRCNVEGMFSLNFVTPGSTYVYDMLKLAVAEDLTVKVTGTGACSTYWKAEDIREIELVTDKKR